MASLFLLYSRNVILNLSKSYRSDSCFSRSFNPENRFHGEMVRDVTVAVVSVHSGE